MADQKTWAMSVRGLVSCVNERGRRVPVPPGQYTVHETGVGQYALSGNGQPDFKLSEKELGDYIRAGEIDVVSGGHWP
jgi:hypothetical protein